jgi:signal transduction histidine kinase
MLAAESAQMTRAEVVENARIIREQGERMTRLVRQLLDFARRRRPEKAPGRLHEVVESVAAMLSPLAGQRNVTLHVEPVTALPPLLIDRGQLEQVLSNLVVNAVHAMPRGGSVEITTAQVEAQPPADHGSAPGVYACLRVTDHGVGIPVEDQSRIFAPFFSTKDVGEGTGLGLSIAHGIVEEHGGWIAVESEPGTGSTFSVYLPLEATS